MCYTFHKKFTLYYCLSLSLMGPCHLSQPRHRLGPRHLSQPRHRLRPRHPLNHVIDWDHAISLKHVIDWDRAEVIERESNRVDQRWIREEIHIRKEQAKSMRRGVLPTFSHL